jgi:hypothetical protein
VLISTVIGLLSIGAIGTLVAVVWSAWAVPLGVVVLLAAGLLYALIAISVAAYKQAHSPFITVGDLEIDIANRIFWVRVENGPVPSKVIGYIRPVTDSLGIRHTGRSWEGHWRDQEPDFDGDLKPFDEPAYGWVQVRHFPSGNPTLAIFTRERADWLPGQPLGHRLVTISQDVPLEQQGTTTLRVVMICSYPPTEAYPRGKQAMEIRRTYSISPDPG